MTRRSSEHAERGARERPGGDGRPGEEIPEAGGFAEDEDAPEAEPRDAAAGDAVQQAEPGPEQAAAEYLDQLQRLKAEFDNYRKRVLREKEEWYQSAQAGVVQRLLPVVDDLRRARGHTQSPDEVPDAAGLYLILKRFEDLLGQLGLEEQPASAGMEFDPEQHEAVMTTSSSEIPEARIVTVLEPGFLYHGRLLRRGKVSVSSGPPPERA
jgi:molecular chaperone GrpE